MRLALSPSLGAVQQASTSGRCSQTSGRRPVHPVRCTGARPTQPPGRAGGRARRRSFGSRSLPLPDAGVAPEDATATQQQRRPLVVKSQPVTRAAAPPPQPAPIEHSSSYLLRSRRVRPCCRCCCCALQVASRQGRMCPGVCVNTPPPAIPRLAVGVRRGGRRAAAAAAPRRGRQRLQRQRAGVGTAQGGRELGRD